MKGNSPLIFQVSGYSNSGKTTLVTKWLSKLHKTGIKAATIKHHGHSKSLTSADASKDSSEHRKAGAIGSFTVSDKEFQWHMDTSLPISLVDIISFYKRFPLDILLIEGYKKENYPKILLLRDENDRDLLVNCKQVEAVVCWKYEEYEKLKKKLSIPVFYIKEEEKYLNWLMYRVEQKEDL